MKAKQVDNPVRLISCPFCGSDRTEVKSWAVGVGGFDSVQFSGNCSACGAYGPFSGYEGTVPERKRKAADQWDARAVDAPTDALGNAIFRVETNFNTYSRNTVHAPLGTPATAASAHRHEAVRLAICADLERMKEIKAKLSNL